MVVARLLTIQTAAFSTAGWIVSAALDATGVLALATALFVTGLAVGIVAGLVALESSNVPVSLPMRAAQTFTLTGITDRAGLGVPVTRAQALAVVSAVVSACGLVAAAVLVG